MKNQSLCSCLAAGLLLAVQPGVAHAGPWMQGSLYFQIPGVTLKVNSRCATASSAEVMIGGLSTAPSKGTASDDRGMNPVSTPSYWIKTADNQVFALPVLVGNAVLIPEGVPSGSIVFTTNAPCTEGTGGPSGSFFGIYSDAHASHRVFAFP